MHPRQIREITRPLLPSWVNFISDLHFEFVPLRPASTVPKQELPATKATRLGAFIQAFELRARLVPRALYATRKALSYKAAKLAAPCLGSVDASQAP
jgi:hypothetical protein